MGERSPFVFDWNVETQKYLRPRYKSLGGNRDKKLDEYIATEKLNYRAYSSQKSEPILS